MALVAIVLYYVANWPYAIPLYSLAAAGFVLKKSQALLHWFYWLLVSAILLSYLVNSWPQEGNNYYLYLYLSLTVLVGCLTNSADTIERNCQGLIGFIFAYASFWKLVSGTYLNGAFFRENMLFDPRLSQIARTLFSENNLQAIPTTHPQMFEILVNALTWSGVVIEVAIAICFLIPIKHLKHFRDPLLVCFCMVGYALIPVPAFGMTVTCLGYGQSRPRYRRIYLALFIVMPLSTFRIFLG